MVFVNETTNALGRRQGGEMGPATQGTTTEMQGPTLSVER
jgi:hypothetical protein